MSDLQTISLNGRTVSFAMVGFDEDGLLIDSVWPMQTAWQIIWEFLHLIADKGEDAPSYYELEVLEAGVYAQLLDRLKDLDRKHRWDSFEKQKFCFLVRVAISLASKLVTNLRSHGGKVDLRPLRGMNVSLRDWALFNGTSIGQKRTLAHSLFATQEIFELANLIRSDLLRLYRDHFRFSAMDGAEKLLKMLTVPKVIVTACEKQDAECKLLGTGLSQAFDGLYAAGGGEKKDLFLKVSQDFRVRPSDILYFDDSGHGLRAALLSGCLVAAVPDLDSSEVITVQLEDLLRQSQYAERFLGFVDSLGDVAASLC